MITRAGTYKAKAYEVMLGKSANKGTPFVGVKFNVTEGEFAGQVQKWEGYLTDKTAERTLTALRNCGWEGDDLSELASGLHGLNKNEVEIVVEMELGMTDPSKVYPRIQWVNAIGGGASFAGEPMDVAQAAEFGRKFRGLAMSLKAKGPKPNASTEKDDGIPF